MGATPRFAEVMDGLGEPADRPQAKCADRGAKMGDVIHTALPKVASGVTMGAVISTKFEHGDGWIPFTVPPVDGDSDPSR